MIYLAGIGCHLEAFNASGSIFAKVKHKILRPHRLTAIVNPLTLKQTHTHTNIRTHSHPYISILIDLLSSRNQL